jgi:hypothetical protein
MKMMHGGARKGAGRKPLPIELRRETVAVRLPHWLIEYLDDSLDADECRAGLIERALIKYLRLERAERNIKNEQLF